MDSVATCKYAGTEDDCGKLCSVLDPYAKLPKHVYPQVADEVEYRIELAYDYERAREIKRMG